MFKIANALAKCVKHGDCMLWHGSDLDDLPTELIGYTTHEGRKVPVPRAIYAVHNGLTLKHLDGCIIGRTCGQKRCCNPEHLCIRARRTLTKTDAYEEANSEILDLASRISGTIIEVAAYFNIHPYEVYRLRSGHLGI